jgi:hypothetical protein
VRERERERERERGAKKVQNYYEFTAAETVWHHHFVGSVNIYYEEFV